MGGSFRGFPRIPKDQVLNYLAAVEIYGPFGDCFESFDAFNALFLNDYVKIGIASKWMLAYRYDISDLVIKNIVA